MTRDVPSRLAARDANLEQEVAMGHVHRLRPLKVLLASRDPRYVTVTGFLLRRAGMQVVRGHRSTRLADLVERRAVGLAVVDADSFPREASEASGWDLPAIVVSEGRRGPGMLPKWGPFDDLLAEIERLQSTAWQPRARVRAAAAADGG